MTSTNLSNTVSKANVNLNLTCGRVKSKLIGVLTVRTITLKQYKLTKR